MFGFEWSEIAVIAVVALICIGPKDMPVAIRAITRIIKKMRRMAGEFQTHVDDMLREADMHEVSDTIRDIRGMSVRGVITRAIDPDGSITRNIADPFHDKPVPPVSEHNVAERPAGPVQPPPDFLPPGARPPATIQPPPSWASASPDFVPPPHDAARDRARDQALGAESP